MKQRFITGLIGGIGFLLFLFYGGIPFTVLVVTLASLAYFEFLRMNDTKVFALEGIIGLFSMILLILSHNQVIFSKSIDSLNILILTVLVYLFAVVLKKNKFSFDEIGYDILGIIYIGYGFSYMLETRFMENGLKYMLLILIATWASDTGAYLTGKYFGRNKLWPKISPKKTVEGSLGGIVFSVISSLILNIFLLLNDQLVIIIWLAITIAVTGQIGDLVESALKRSKNIKDSGTILPGHGGVLDRFDSLIFVFPLLHLLNIL